MSNNMIVAGMAYRSALAAKNLVPYHHKKAAGGHRDYTANPIPRNEVKQFQIDRAVNRPGTLDPRTRAPTQPRGDNTRKENDVANNVKQNEAGTTSNMKGIMIVGGVLLAAGLVYYYYR